MADKKLTAAEPHALVPLPELRGRVAALCVGLALRQVQQQGIVLCLDARRHRQAEVQFRLLLRGSAHYVPLPASGEVPAELVQTALRTLSRGLTQAAVRPPLLLLDSVRENPDWERTLAFLLNAGAVVVDLLPSPTALVFGRYDTVLLLRTDADAADAYSRAAPPDAPRVSALTA